MATASPEIPAGLRSAALLMGLTVAAISGAILAAWLLGGSFAAEVAERMKSNTSLGLSLCGLALSLRATQRLPRLADAFAALAMLIGAITLIEYLAGIELGVDQLVQREHSTLAEALRHPDRMGPNAAVGLLIAGVGLLATARSMAAAGVSQVCGLLLFMVGFTASIGYLYGATPLYQPTSSIHMSGLTSLSMMLLGMGLLSLRTDVGFSQLLAARDAGGWVLRRALPVVIALPALCGWLRIGLQKEGVVDTATGTALLVVVLTLVCATLATLLARSVARADGERRLSEKSLEAQAKLTAALSRATTVDDVARVMVNEGAAALEAAGTVLLLPIEGVEELEPRSIAGYGRVITDQYPRIRFDAPLPVAESWRTSEPVLIHSRAELFARYPSVPHEHVPYESSAALPLLGRDRVLGVLVLSFSTPRRFAGAELDLLTGLAWHCAQAVERALLLDSERALRAAAERTTAELRAAQQAAVAANQTKDEFLAMLGHELRNPLAPIAIALDMLDRRHDPHLQRERKIISRQVKHLMRMVDDLLDVSRIARGKIELNRTRFELKSVVHRAIELAAPLLEQKQHHLNVDVADEGLPLWGDEHRLTQVVSNLLTNAARYTDDGGHIAVHAVKHGERVGLVVTDDGDGIDPEQLPRLFEAFVQAPTDQRSSAGGLGLGLALVKRFTELHGGNAHAHSDGLGEGSTFTVELPLAPPAPLARSSAPRPRLSFPGSGRRVLVVDDNIDAAEMLAEGLRAEGHDVEVAHDGPAALELADRSKPVVAFLDLGLPEMSGYEVGSRLRQLVPGVVLVAVTGYGQPSDRARSQAAGFQHHLVKPVDLETTLGIARDAIRTPEAESHVAAP